MSAARAYPDSASIDRRTWNAEADWSRALEKRGFRRGAGVAIMRAP